MKFGPKIRLFHSILLLVSLIGCSSAPLLVAPNSESNYPINRAEPAKRSDLGHISLLSDDQSSNVTIAAMSLVGTPYRFGGNTPEAGFDCSGFIAYVYRTHAQVKSPRTTAKLNDWGVEIPLSQLRSGDIVLFGKGSVPSHVGIYVGENRFVHAPATGGAVRLERMQSRYWAQLNPRFRRPATV